MNTTPLTVRLSAAVASIAIAVSICAGVAHLAELPVASSLLAQAGTALVVR